jgi:hypothetical protein
VNSGIRNTLQSNPAAIHATPEIDSIWRRVCSRRAIEWPSLTG